MADDDAGDWFADTGDDTPEQQNVSESVRDLPKTLQTETNNLENNQDIEKNTNEENEQEVEDEYFDPNKLLLFKHWIRPKFLQYKYLYDYRHNYYDDVIDYLDKKQKGLKRDIPHPQTWAERTLRTYNSQINKVESFRSLVCDTKLITKTKLSGAFQLHHSKTYINRRYSSILA